MARAATTTKRKTEITPAKRRAVDPWYWAQFSGIRLSAGPFTHENHEYLAEPLRDEHPSQVAMKGAQMGWTEKAIVKTLHGMIHKRYPQGVLHLFPTADDVTDFSKARFTPLIDNNPDHVGRFIQNTDAANIKRIRDSMLYLRGARPTRQIEGLTKTSSKLKSIPVDRIVFDEYDEMDQAMIALALERVAHSKIQEIEELSTPTIPDYGIDASYKKSDQNAWELICGSCGRGTILELEFPRCIQRRKDGTAFRACVHCGKEIYPKDGIWRAQRPQVKDKRGWWISQLNSSYVNLTKLLVDFERIQEMPGGDRQVFYNSKLGRAYVDAANRLTKQDLYRCVGQDVMEYRHSGPTAMGVDIGSWLHVVIGYKPAPGVIKICHAGRVKEWNELHDLGVRFNVDCAVIDLEPEVHKAREFRKAERYQVFLSDYQEHQRGDARWDLDQGLVVMNRTELLDRVHTQVATPGRFIMPRLNDEVEEYVTEMCNLVKVIVEKPSGDRLYEYKQVGPDHYRHATAYLLLASERITCYQPRGAAPWMDVRPARASIDYDPLDNKFMNGQVGSFDAITEYNPFK